ncbi:MAG: hypothetical protein M3Z98_03910 [Candidatus Dormibacteraeota bacterium]|nr:hypothetical protein [Candidatus Dormibacteraeota bacterium]
MAEDPELERRLEAMFASARPRRGFADELWRRIEARRSWYQRLGLGFQPVLRYAPALATLLVVALGVTWLATSFRGGAGNDASTTSAGAPGFASKENGAAAPAFGKLPSAMPETARSGTAPQTTTADSGAGHSFGGTLPNLPATLPVYRYDEPTSADRERIGAAMQSQSGLPAIAVTLSDVARDLEPQFVVNSSASSPAPGSSPAEAANTFLTGHGLAPHFAFQVSVSGSGGQVLYQRVFDGPAGPIRQVRRDGGPAGLVVDFTGGTISARGPLELPLTIAQYPLRSASGALAAANVPTATGAAGYDKAELVYVLAISGGHGYYEPALLLSGPGGSRLAPAIAAEWLGA